MKGGGLTVTLQIGYIGSKPMRAYQNRFRLDRFGYMFLYLQLLAGGKIPTFASENAGTSNCMSSWMLETTTCGGIWM